MPGPVEAQSSGENTATAETEIAATLESARQDLGRGQEQLRELEGMLASLSQTTATFASVSNQLSSMVITAAGVITRTGSAGRPFMPFIEQLAELTRVSLGALQELRRQAADSSARVSALRTVAERSRATLDRLGPAVSSVGEAATHAPAVEVVVRAPVSAADKNNRIAQLTEEVLRERERRATGGLKN
jgi:ABC-type transporter Mla subunit MlaD